jgi:hypothetical protein
MNRRDFGKVLLSSALMPALGTSDAPAERGLSWSLRATIAECCSCPIPCPCNFGRPTDRGCFGNRLIRIREGNFEGADLTGATFLVTFSMGQWTRLYLSDAMSSATAAALDGVLPVAFGGFRRLAQTIDRIPLVVQEGDGTLSFSAPESSVVMKMVAGLDGGPIRISGLPNPAYRDYTQYESVSHVHRSAEANWSYSGTNGFVSEMRASG